MALEMELEYFNQHKDEWLTIYENQFALIKDRILHGTFTTWDEAFSEGIRRFGNVPFLVKQILKQEQTVQFPALVVGALSVRS